MAVPSASFRLPEPFLATPFLAFHGRDQGQDGVSERLSGNTLEKGLLIEGQPVLLRLQLDPSEAHCELDTNGKVPEDADALQLGQRLLGIHPQVPAFEQAFRNHPQLGPLLAAQPGYYLPQSATPFEALAWAITGQMVSVASAVAVRRRLNLAAGRRHSSGLYCVPEAADLARLGTDQLRAAGLSRMKADCLARVAAMVCEGRLPLERWRENLQAEEVAEHLLAIHGIGPWTVHYTLLRGFHYLDASMEGDVAVRLGLQRLLKQRQPVSPAQAREWLAPFAPWRSLVAARLWAVAA